MRRARVLFAHREIEFVNRGAALRQVEDIAEEGTRFPIVVYGPEGCGKTALLRQAVEILREHGYAVVHINPLAEAVEEKLSITEELKDITRQLGMHIIGDASRLIEKAVELLYTAVRRGIRRRIALLVDDLFQAIGLDRAEALVKSMLNTIEWPSVRYENIAILTTSSEGITRERIGRHNWATLRIMWNMSRDGFRQLYNTLPNPKPQFEDVWRSTGGNPRMLERMHEAKWDPDKIIADFMASRRLKAFTASLSDEGRGVLREMLQSPDVILNRLRIPEAQHLERRLIELNLVIEVWDRNQWLWIDTPPPEEDLELGIGRYYAWQTPIHREAVRRVLEGAK